MTTRPLDATSAPTTPFNPTAHHTALHELVGRWAGETQLYLDPSAPPETSRTEATVESLLGGRWVRIDYQGTAMGKPHAGVLMLGYHRDAHSFEAAWIDSFHTGTAIMLSVGEPGDGSISVLGSYAAGAERWGWRTTLRRDGADGLVIEALNITPAGEAHPAVTTRLRRA
jgi:hypothetical protein